MKTAIYINGGLGRCVSALPALIQRGDIVITSGWEEMFDMTPLKTIESFSGAIGDYLEEYDIITPEPYHLAGVRNGKMSLAEGFHHILGTDPSVTEGLYPDIEASARWMYHFDSITEKPICVIQAAGSSDINPRDLTAESTANAIAVVKEAGYYPVVVGSMPNYDMDCEVLTDTSLTDYISIISVCKLFIGGDSSGMHIASAFGKKGIICLTATAQQVNCRGNFVTMAPANLMHGKSFPRFFREESKQRVRQIEEGIHKHVFTEEDFEEALTTLKD